MKTKEVEVEIPQKEGAPMKFRLRGLTYKENNNCMKRAGFHMNSLGQMEGDVFAYTEIRLAESIMSPVEFAKNLEKVGGLDVQTAQRLNEIVNDLNGVSPNASGALEAPSLEEPQSLPQTP